VDAVIVVFGLEGGPSLADEAGHGKRRTSTGASMHISTSWGQTAELVHPHAIGLHIERTST